MHVEVIEVRSATEENELVEQQQDSSSSRLDSNVAQIELDGELLGDVSTTLLGPNVFVALHAQGRELLERHEPRYVILYEYDLASIRHCECFRAARPGSPLRIYTLVFEHSAEERAYADAVVRENDAFEALIEEKARLVLPPSWTPPPPVVNPPPPPVELPATLRNASTLRNNSTVNNNTPHIIVDTRELRPGIALPSLLQLRGVVLHAVALDAGDYVLTPDLCVERKAIADLIGSFADGRLYAQTERLSRLYRHPVLLIEGHAGTRFELQPDEELGDEVSHTALSSKLALLCLHFPALRLLWSADAHHTAELFMALKQGGLEPDVRAVKLSEDEHESRGNEVPADILRRLPGVTRASLPALTLHVSSLRALTQLSVDELEPLVRVRGDAQRLHTFLNKDLRAAPPPPRQHHHHNHY